MKIARLSFFALCGLACTTRDATDSSSTHNSSASSGSSAAGSSSSSSSAASVGSLSSSSSSGGASSANGSSASSPASSAATSTGGACNTLSDGPFTPTVFNNTLMGSEDIGFDALGHLAGKRGSALVLLDSQGQSTTLVATIAQSYGVRFMLGGDLLVALPGSGTVKRVTTAGVVSNFDTGLGSPNGIFADVDGNVWVTDFSKVARYAAGTFTRTFVVSGSEGAAANGVLYDKNRGLLFFTNYSSGRIASVTVTSDGTAGTPVEVTTLSGTPDGLAMDECGHLYVVDQSAGTLYRIRLDAAGAAVGNATLLADFPLNVANVQFGRGAGFSETSLYAAGNPGTVYVVPVGVRGTAIP